MARKTEARMDPDGAVLAEKGGRLMEFNRAWHVPSCVNHPARAAASPVTRLCKKCEEKQR